MPVKDMSQTPASPIQRLLNLSLVSQIIIGLILGLLLAYFAPAAAQASSLLGTLFVGALKAVAPILVFILVLAAVTGHQQGTQTRMRPLLLLYVFGTFSAALVAVLASFAFPTSLKLVAGASQITPPGQITEVLGNLLFNLVSNPIKALADANYIGILAWALALGLPLRHASEATRNLIQELAGAVSTLVRAVIRCAPLGILGLVAGTLAESGFGALLGYAQLLVVLLGCMLFIALVVNPLIVFGVTRQNPYPLVLTCLKESGLTAFFTRSSAANIPVNMALCERLGLPRETYSLSIPLGATINMAGAAITITVLTLAAVHTLGIQIDMASALLLSIIATVSACGASGVAGGSLLLIPLACSLFGIDNEVAMQVVAVGFIIGVLQDAAETALNSSTDVIFTAAACRHGSDQAQVELTPASQSEA